MPSPLFTRYQSLEVFAVEDRSVQVVWRNQPVGDMALRVGGRTTSAHSSGGPGAVVLDGLSPNTRYDLDVTIASRRHRLTFCTLPAPDAPVLARIATISDLHLGEYDFGLIRRATEDVEPTNRHPIRCTKAAIREALDWGAQLIMFKGDITNKGMTEEWEIAEKLLSDVDVPVLIAPGNHDTFCKPGSRNALDALSEIGHPIDGVVTFDLDGVRVILGDTTVPTHSWGRLDHIHDGLIDAAATWSGPVLVGLHHHLQQLPIPWFWPLGIAKPAGDKLLTGLRNANHRTFVTCGHTHRNRLHTRGVLPVSEVASAKDYPGVWAGYEITETAIRQVVRRVAAPEVIGWTDGCRNAVGGIWGMWSPGTIDQRSFVHRW